MACAFDKNTFRNYGRLSCALKYNMQLFKGGKSLRSFMMNCLWIATSLICQLWLIREDTSVNRQQSSVNAYKYFSVTEFVTFRIVYLISWLRRRLMITLEDCLIKLICLTCGVAMIVFVLYAFFFSLCWAYISGWYSPLCPVIIFIKLCLLA